MNLRHVPPEMDSSKVAQIDLMLEEIAVNHGILIPLAIESGSRAWGFPSPDSDYDCRFFYVRSNDDHLTPWSVRDVIELPIQGDLDVNGWDLAKAVRLLLKGNAVVLEWLMSPIMYRVDADFRAAFLDLAVRVVNRNAIAKHYLHLGRRQRQAYLVGNTMVPQKKIFYALRPAAALRWLWVNPTERVAPMNFETLLAECDPPTCLLGEVEELLRRKKETRELGDAPISLTIMQFIDDEFDRWGAVDLYKATTVNEAARAAAADFYRDMVVRFSAAQHARVSPPCGNYLP